MKKIKMLTRIILSVLCIMIFLIPSTVVHAGLTTLDYWGSDTYVESYHGDDYFDETYIGGVYIRGMEWKLLGSRWHYPTKSKITY